MPLRNTLDEWLASRPPWQVLALALFSLVVVGLLDYWNGYEMSLGVFYLGPVALAAWYVGRRAGTTLALLACVTWYAADVQAGHPYSHPLIPVWNALVRLGFFLVTALLLGALRTHLNEERQYARTDALTGLFNSRAFQEKLDYALALAGRDGRPLTLAYIDLDHFKAVNDQYGHSEGDRILRLVGQAMMECLRRSDTAARMGGDEFAVLLTNPDGGGAAAAISKLRKRLQELLNADGRGVTCSIGAVTFQKLPESADEAIKAADAAMYEVKRKARDEAAFQVSSR